MNWNKIKLIKKSGFFDESYYLDNNSDVKNSGLDPIKHYLKYGWKEGRNPSERFDTNFYLQTYQDVKNAKVNPLIHFIKFGIKEGRKPRNDEQVISFTYKQNKIEKITKAIRLYKDNPILINKVFREIKRHGIKNTLNKINNKLRFQQHHEELLKNDRRFPHLPKDMSNLTGEISNYDKSIVFTVPCLSYGGGELYMLNVAKAIHKIDSTIKIFVIVPEFIGECRPDIQLSYDFIKFIFIRDIVGKDDIPSSYIFLKDLLLYIKPVILHNINSSITWRLMIKESNELKFYINKFYACIFCEQYNEFGELEGFAKDYLENGINCLDMLISDNTKFEDFATKTFSISKENLDKFKVLYNPIKLDVSEIVNQCRIKYLTEKLDFKKLLWIGRLDEQKNIKLAFELAIAKPDIEIHIFGSKLIDNTEFGVIPKNIIFKGLTFDIPKTILSDNYSAFILTSKYEGLPNILIECGYLGIPIIAPNVGGVSDLINFNTGYLLSEKPKVEEYISVIQNIQSEPKIRIEKSQALIKLIEERHTLDYLVNDIKNLNYLSYENVNSKKLVSIIIPCYNQYEFLASCLESCYASYSGPLEIIVVDDCSTDKKKSQYQFIINQIYPSVKFVNNQINIGLAATRNVGLKNVTGEYIQFLDADDILLPNKISNQVRFLNTIENPENLIILSDYIFSNHDMSTISYESTISQFEINLENLLMHWERGFSIPIHTGLFPSSIVNYSFNEKLPAKEDWFFWINLVANNYKFKFLDIKSLVYRMNDQSMTKSKFLMSGQAWINVSYFILDYLDNKITKEMKINFLSEVVEHYRNWYLPNSINEINIKNNEQNTEINTIKYEYETNVESIKKIDINNKPIVDITVLIPIFNHYEYLVECIDSVLNQTHLPSEILLLNDNSSDIRVQVLLKKYEETYSNIIKFINFNENIGISKIQNYGTNIARGKYIAFLDCDDYLELDAFEKISDYLDMNTDYIFTDNYHVYPDLKKRAIYGGYNNISFTSQFNIKNDLLNGMVANHLKIIKVESLKLCNLFDESVSGVQDWDLALKFCQKNFSFYYLSLPLYNHRIHENSVTSSMKMIQFKLTNIVRRENVVSRYPHLTEDTTNTVSIYHKCELSMIHKYLNDNFKLIFVLDEHSTMDDYWFINEFNGFFDYIKLNSVQYSYISGYLWDSKIIR